MNKGFLFLSLSTLLVLTILANAQAAYYVATDGDDTNGNGSSSSPWATITKALDSVPSGSLILVRPGRYDGRIRIRGNFSPAVIVRSEEPYKAMLRHTGTVITSYDDNIRGITIKGFDISHSGSGAAPLVVHIDGGGNNEVSNITIKNNILHDSYNNDILKINNGATNILVEGNVFYNQSGSDEHIDINSVENVTVQKNIFFNDFEGSGRINGNNTSSYIVIKDSNGSGDIFVGSKNVEVKQNVFLNWQGSTGSNFVLVGEDGKSYFEGEDILVENNLMIGNSSNVMRAPFGVKGGKDIVFRNNTVTGDMPSYAFAMRLNREGLNPANQNIQFYNNIWVDQTGTMGATSPSSATDFSDTPPADTVSYSLDNNLYWNGGAAIPTDFSEKINYTDDSSSHIIDPLLKNPENVPLPRWNEVAGSFGDGSTTITQSFQKLVAEYCQLSSSSGAIDQGLSSNSPTLDILGNIREPGKEDLGACEYVQNGGGGGSGGGNSGGNGDGVTIVPVFSILLSR